jgi:3-mercaptopyruvate sulfurtransferase SseA
VRVLDGGIEGWGKAGFEPFSGVHVPSKAFGEFVETSEHTPPISAEELSELQSSGANHVVLDSRPLDEFREVSIPEVYAARERSFSTGFTMRRLIRRHWSWSTAREGRAASSALNR